MIKWLAFVLAILALLALDDIQARIGSLENNRTCTLMVVLTPSGQATICALASSRASVQ